MRRSRSAADAAKTSVFARIAAVLAAATVLVFAPGIAQAAFNTSTGSALPVGTASMASTATVSASCTGSNLAITVTSWGLADPRFLGQITITSGGSTVFTGTSNQAAGGSYTPKITPHTGTWNWSVINVYSIPNSNNAWTGPGVTGSFTCT
ncbi:MULTISPECIES: hypothetical protein [Arthrobacter]|uniref:Uncharacterized protein n=1 Tax=Arthrobacter terricola TaxID=2547396 RepID=A0A4R5KFY3_9MICC|nr:MULTISPECIES: hypothetical protein [Arthrobacter]MBT8162094.1 hypothetical protein [Arthrobacter sp. GN70]TDF93912.1 hypothetical protein E1809_14760 [Arthrobacter terricola]